jgi:hypothetical protein
VRRTAGCGDASACLMLRTPLIRRDPHLAPSTRVPDGRREIPVKNLDRLP